MTAFPLVGVNNTNLAPMFQGGTGLWDGCRWGDYNLNGQVYYGNSNNPQICFRDDWVTHNCHSSIRIEKQNEFNKVREVNGPSISVHEGDIIYFSCWVKTDALRSGSGAGAIIGFDVYSTGIGRVGEIQTRSSQFSAWNSEGEIVYVPYGSDWTKLILNTTVPNSYLGYTVDSIIPWIGGSWNCQTDYPTVYFADAELYVNPSSSPTAFSFASPYFISSPYAIAMGLGVLLVCAIVISLLAKIRC